MLKHDWQAAAGQAFGPHERRKADGMDCYRSLRQSIVAAVPGLRAYGVALSGSRDQADDLVQETLVRALHHINTFEPGTNLRAWLTTILRNHFVSQCRKSAREVQDVDGIYAAGLVCQPRQESWMAFRDLRKALAKLPVEQRDAVVLVCASGFTYDEAAGICGCPVGTIKSRVSRARAGLAMALALGPADRVPAEPSRSVA